MTQQLQRTLDMVFGATPGGWRDRLWDRVARMGPGSIVTASMLRQEGIVGEPINPRSQWGSGLRAMSMGETPLTRKLGYQVSPLPSRHGSVEAVWERI